MPGHIRAAVINVEGPRGAVRLHRPPQRGEQPGDILPRGPPPAGDEPGMVILDAEQVRLGRRPAGRAARRDPQLPGGVRLEPAEDLRRRPAAKTGQLHPDEVPLDGPHRGHLPGAQPGRQDPVHLRGGPLRLLLLQRDRQLQHPGAGPRLHVPGARHQGIKAAGPPVPDPPIQRGPPDPQQLPARLLMLPGGQRAHQRAPLPRRQVRVRRGADHAVPEQRDVTGPRRPRRQLLVIPHKCLPSQWPQRPQTEGTSLPAITRQAPDAGTWRTAAPAG